MCHTAPQCARAVSNRCRFCRSHGRKPLMRFRQRCRFQEGARSSSRRGGACRAPAREYREGGSKARRRRSARMPSRRRCAEGAARAGRVTVLRGDGSKSVATRQREEQSRSARRVSVAAVRACSQPCNPPAVHVVLSVANCEIC